MVQMFRFTTEALEMYHQRKILSIANNRVDHYISVKLQGKNAAKISREHIKEVSTNPDQFLVRSSRDPDQQYLVDTAIGACGCEAGKDGSPCSHQHAVYINFGKGFVNSIPTLQPTLRRELAKLALGTRAVEELGFYASVTQASDKTAHSSCEADVSTTPDFSESCWATMREGARDESPEKEKENTSEVESALDEVVADLKLRLHNDPQLSSGVQKFVARYNGMTKSNLNALLASSFHRFGWSVGGSTAQL